MTWENEQDTNIFMQIHLVPNQVALFLYVELFWTILFSFNIFLPTMMFILKKLFT